tara:strand:- start:1224 stop:1613 length:390 start_codon:yes stop_codon:yes gene_type:complete
MKPLKVSDNLTLNGGEFIIVAGNNRLDYGWYCGSGRNTLQYFSLWCPGAILTEFEEYEKQGLQYTGWRKREFKKNGFSSKALYKTYINSFGDWRVLKVADPDNLFTNPADIATYEKSKEALIKIKFLNK